MHIYIAISTQITMAGYLLGCLPSVYYQWIGEISSGQVILAVQGYERGSKDGDIAFHLLVAGLTGDTVLLMHDYSYWCSL